MAEERWREGFGRDISTHGVAGETKRFAMAQSSSMNSSMKAVADFMDCGRPDDDLVTMQVISFPITFGRATRRW